MHEGAYSNGRGRDNARAEGTNLYSPSALTNPIMKRKLVYKVLLLTYLKQPYAFAKTAITSKEQPMP